MTDFSTLLQQGNAWLFLPSAVALGALHGLEPGHSKTMMAAFIVAIRGTVTQAVLLGLSATLSHTALVWALALAGLYFGSQWVNDGVEPYLQLASGLMMVAVALWMLWRSARQQHSHEHDHEHDHCHDHDHDNEHQDEHEKFHAREIEQRFANRNVTTGQIVLFGLTGGLIPCPSSITVLLLCLQIKRVALGATLVLGFSVGLALTLVLSGTLAALSVNHLSRRFHGFGAVARKVPYLSGALIMLIGAYVAWQGLSGMGNLSATALHGHP